MMKKLSSWGNYPSIEGEIVTPLKEKVADLPVQKQIPRGLARSYGDSALASKMVSTKLMNHFIDFDAEHGTLVCEAGISLDEILQVFVPKGWFLPVTPGTKFVTIGGAIAADVHGKNHHFDGCFSEFVDWVKLVIGDNTVVCSREENSDLFHATCGGMGLTGTIIEAQIRLKAVSSAYIDQKTLKAKNLATVLDMFEQYEHYTYSVAWIDCLSTGENLGRSLLMLGEHAEHGNLDTHKSGALTMPFNMPSMLLNQFSVQAFNTLYYHRITRDEINERIHYQPFFYPLDGINHWNRMYGKNGFTQYQFVIPKAAGLAGLTEILTAIADSKQGSFLSVLKVFGKGNSNLLSFPTEGYTLALDFKITDQLFALLNRLDEIVSRYKGRLYLVKDARMSEQMFKQGYPRWEEFQQIREKYHAIEHYNSLQSQRIGL